MIERTAYRQEILRKLKASPIVSLLGPRQAGKTTLARQITQDRPAHFFEAYFWATHAGAELDLLVLRNGKRVGIEFKHSDAPTLTKSMHIALKI